jgi:integrase
VPINVIQAQLGHTNIAAASRYLVHIAPAEVIRVMQGRDWEL